MNSKKTITRIQITGLFGRVDYDFPLGDMGDISILTAPNGMGKTTILNLIDFLFNPCNDSFETIKKVPFMTFRCILSDGTKVCLSKNDTPIKDKKTRKKQRLRDADSARFKNDALFDHGDFSFYVIGSESHEKPEVREQATYFSFTEVYDDAVNHDPLDYVPSDVMKKYRRPLYRNDPMIPLYYIWKLQREVLEKYDIQLKVNYIKADRIQPVLLPRDYEHDYGDPQQESPMKIASNDIGRRISEATEKYQEEVSRAKDELPRMFIEHDDKVMNEAVFSSMWNEYQSELEEYQAMGLISYSDEFFKSTDIISLYDNDEVKRRFLNTYIQAFYSTTETLEDIYYKLHTFQDIINKRNRITGKTLCFSKNGAFFRAEDRIIELDSLSSGEKHDFLMFYNLIFNTDENTLVLIDEPEISLHIEWQEAFLDELIEIQEWSELQAIVATHSPYIVGSHYDLIIDKGGEADE